MKGCGNGCVWIFAIALVVGSCMQMPILIVPTVIVLAVFAHAWARKHPTPR